MDRLTRAARQADHLQEGVSAARATLHAIHGAALFDVLPIGDGDRLNHSHGLQLLSMLEDCLAAVQAKVDQIGGAGEDR